LALAALVSILAAGCRPARHQGPIVLITVDALRADVVGALGGPAGLTPSLDGLAAEASFAGRAVSASCWTVPAMASLVTGLQPFRHGVYEGARAALPHSLPVLPELLAAAGWHTAAFRSNHWLSPTFGYDRGYAEFRALQQGKRAENTLAAFDGSRQFVWIHVLPPHAPYQRLERFASRIADAPPELPEKLKPLDLEPFFDPAAALSADERARAWAMYRYNVAYADEIVGNLLAALRKSGHYDDTLLVVTADHGEEFEEEGQVLHGGDLNRVLVEVPLVVKLPKGFARPLAVRPGDAVGTMRLAATLLGAAGVVPAPGMAPSLFTSGPQAVLSELYLGNGTNQFSLVDGDGPTRWQLRWQSRFAAAEPEYYRARLAFLGATVDPPTREEPSVIFGRLETAFYASLPLSGSVGTPELRLARWLEGGGSETATDPARLDRMARALKQQWRELIGNETRPQPLAAGDRPQLSPEEAAKIRALGYVAGGDDRP
jgi:hypothetical protein